MSVALAKTAAVAYERLAQASANDAERSGNLLNLSSWLSELGRWEEALAVICRNAWTLAALTQNALTWQKRWSER